MKVAIKSSQVNGWLLTGNKDVLCLVSTWQNLRRYTDKEYKSKYTNIHKEEMKKTDMNKYSIENECVSKW